MFIWLPSFSTSVNFTEKIFLLHVGDVIAKFFIAFAEDNFLVDATIFSLKHDLRKKKMSERILLPTMPSHSFFEIY